MSARKVTVDGLGRLPTFCHAVVAGDFIHVSGTLGTAPGSFELVEGGTGPETRQTLRNIETILQACDAGLSDPIAGLHHFSPPNIDDGNDVTPYFC